MLDIATGGGDVPLRLWQRARRAGLDIDVHGCDISTTALDQARARAQDAQADITFFCRDVLNDGIPPGYDVITCSLFLHHLAEDEARTLLGRLRAGAGRLVLINDLRRCRAGYLLAWLGSRVLTTSAVVRFDGPVSVEGAFTSEEAANLAAQAGMTGVQVTHHWPCRFLLTWRRP